jgi:hypothetical protein
MPFGIVVDSGRLPIVSGNFPLNPLRYRLFTPELQWQSRGKRRISQGCKPETPGAGRPKASV